MTLFSELKRRNVFRVGTAYVIVGWLVTEILATLMPMFGVPDWVGKAVVIVVAVTFIPVLIFAWAFELTPEGIKREKDVDRDTSITSDTGKKLNYVTIAAVILGMAFLAWSKTSVDVPVPSAEITETSGSPSVAVLPFVNMSGNAENEYFSDGLTETLLHMLAQVPDIKVAARTSSFAFKGQEQDIRKIALALGVAHILEGSVQRSGDKVRVTAQLIRADDGFHVWSSNYDRTLNDIFAIQDEIATDVGHSLTASLLGNKTVAIEGVETQDVIAYDLYLQALSHRANGSYAGLDKAEELLKQALLIDSEFLDAKYALAGIYMLQQNTGLRDQDEAYESAVQLLQQILEVRPGDVLARAEFISVTAHQAENAGAYRAIPDAVPMLQELVDLLPNDADLRILYSKVLSQAGHPVDALAQIEYALLLDPMNPIVHFQLGTINIRLGNWDVAKKALQRSLQLAPDQPNISGRLSDIDYSLGNAVGIVQNAFSGMTIDPKDHEIVAGLASYLYKLGLLEQADVFRDRATLIARNSPATRMAVLLSAKARGDKETSDQVARQMIADNIDERHGSYFEAAYTVMSNAVAREDAAEGLQFMERQQPGFNDPTSNELPFKVRGAQAGAFAAWDAAFGREKAAQRCTDYWRVSEQSGTLKSDIPEIYLEVLAMQGDSEAAIDFAVENVLTKPITLAMWWREIFDSPHMAEVAADRRVQARLRQWDADLLRARKDVTAYLASRQ